MRIKAEIEFEVPKETIDSIRRDGLWISAFLHDEIDIGMTHKARGMGYSITGIKVGEFPTGTLYDKEVK